MEVFIPSWNCERTLEKCLASLSATGNDWDICLVDRFSSDRTKAIARKYGARVYSADLNLGGARTWICEYARGAWFFMLDADVYVPEDWEKDLLHERDVLLGSDIRVGAVQSNDIDAPSIQDVRLQKSYMKYVAWRHRSQTFPSRNFARLDTNATLFRKEAVKGYRCNVSAFEDYELGRQIMWNGFNYYAVNVPVVHDELLSWKSLKQRNRCSGAAIRQTGCSPFWKLLAGLFVAPFRVPSGAKRFALFSYWHHLVGWFYVEKYAGHGW